MKPFNPFSISNILISLLLAVFILGGHYFYVIWFIKKVEPAAKLATEERLGVNLERSLSGHWQVTTLKNPSYQGSKALLYTKVFLINFALWGVFASAFIIEIIILYLFFRFFYKQS